MKQNYDFCLKEVLKSEGGYTNDPRDPGGPTNFGITIFDYRAYINPHGTAQDVRNMKLDDAKRIYKSKYWDACSCDELPSGVDYSVFDYGVNSGIGRAKRVLQRCMSHDDVETINNINNERIHFLQSLTTWNHFGAGWGARVRRVRADSLRLAQHPTTPPAEIPQLPTNTPSIPSLPDINTQVSAFSSIINTVKEFVSQNMGSLGRHISTGAVVAYAALSDYWPYILGGVALAVVIWIALKYYQQRNS